MLTSEEIERVLARFKQNPKQFMNEHPAKIDAQGNVITGFGLFGTALAQSRGYVTAKDRARSGMRVMYEGVELTMEDFGPGKAAMADMKELNRPENLVDNGANLVRTLEEMESKELKSGKLAESPWSDTYWPMYQGILGVRYADDQFPSNRNENATFGDNYKYIMNNPAGDIISGGDESALDLLSPSEKYDLLVGDSSFALTRAMWAEAKSFQDPSGTVATWMGICDGWAPASYCVPRPANVVEVQVQIGGKVYTIRFYPSDIKGLASLLWAKGKLATNWAGGRCNDPHPEQDANGRVVSSDCFDTNPGAWHLSIVNQIGISKRSFVMDATYDYEVWNQPIYKYSYSYFNPETGREYRDLNRAIVSRSQFSSDIFSPYRALAAEYFVGIAMRVTYVAETSPSQSETDSEDSDALTSVDYQYDLELDGGGNVIGGEWYKNAHPDFLWTPKFGDEAESSGDAGLDGNWDGEGPLPEEWKDAARGDRQWGQPLAKIVDVLVERSR